MTGEQDGAQSTFQKSQDSGYMVAFVSEFLFSLPSCCVFTETAECSLLHLLVTFVQKAEAQKEVLRNKLVNIRQP